MARIVVTANVEDLVKWEEGFRKHGDLFRSQTVSGSIGMATTEGNDVAVCFEAAPNRPNGATSIWSVVHLMADIQFSMSAFTGFFLFCEGQRTRSRKGQMGS